MPKSVEQVREAIMAAFDSDQPDYWAVHDGLQDLIDAVRHDDVVCMSAVIELNPEISTPLLIDRIREQVPSE